MLNNIGLPGILLIAIVVLVLFGRGKISSLMGEVGKGITSFKRGVAEGNREADEDQASLPDHGDTAPPGHADRVQKDATVDPAKDTPRA